MVEGLIGVLIFAFVTLIVGIIIRSWFAMVPQMAIIVIVVYLLVRVRVKISRAEKEKLRDKITDLEKKIVGLAHTQD